MRAVGPAPDPPDLVVTDVRMPPAHSDEGLRAAVHLRSLHPRLPVLVLSQYVEQRYASELFAGDVRGLGYVLGLTLLVTLLGAAGMAAFEPASEVAGGFDGFGHALWWTAMLMTTMGSDFWPRTPEGRVLCVLLALYAFAVFGYITASMASLFVDPGFVDIEVAPGAVLERVEVLELDHQGRPVGDHPVGEQAPLGAS